MVVFHEQLMRIMQKMTGCSLAQADEMRRKLGKESKAASVSTYFHKAAAARGYQKQIIDKVWSIIEGFGSFGSVRLTSRICTPTYHSAAQTTTPRVHCGLLTHDPGCIAGGC